MSYIGHLNEKYGQIEFWMDEDGLITFEHEGIDIVNPMVSCCGRFEFSFTQITNEYGIEGADAAYIAGQNLLQITNTQA